MENLFHATAEPIQTDCPSIVYLLRPRIQLVAAIASQIRADQKHKVPRSYFAYFVPKCTLPCRKVRSTSCYRGAGMRPGLSLGLHQQDAAETAAVDAHEAGGSCFKPIQRRSGRCCCVGELTLLLGWGSYSAAGSRILLRCRAGGRTLLPGLGSYPAAGLGVMPCCWVGDPTLPMGCGLKLLRGWGSYVWRQVLESSPELSQLAVGVYPLQFFPLEDDALSLELDSAFKACHAACTTSLHPVPWALAARCPVASL